MNDVAARLPQPTNYQASLHCCSCSGIWIWDVAHGPIWSNVPWPIHACHNHDVHGDGVIEGDTEGAVTECGAGEN